MTRTEAAASPFRLRVGEFEGPFDLLLALIAKHELEITELALSVVTDEFLAHLGSLDDGADMEAASAFLLVGATLLDLKIAGLLPRGEVVDAEDVALLEARDLLFARLLQYRAFKDVATWFADGFAVEARRHGRTPELEERHRGDAPLAWTLSADAFARLAAAVLAPKPEPVVATDHLHASPVSLREQAAIIAAALRHGDVLAFTDLAGDGVEVDVVVARFLAVLELYRHGAIAFEQLEPLGALLLRWSGEEWNETSLDALGRDWERAA